MGMECGPKERQGAYNPENNLHRILKMLRDGRTLSLLGKMKMFLVETGDTHPRLNPLILIIQITNDS